MVFLFSSNESHHFQKKFQTSKTMQEFEEPLSAKKTTFYKSRKRDSKVISFGMPLTQKTQKDFFSISATKSEGIAIENEEEDEEEEEKEKDDYEKEKKKRKMEEEGREEKKEIKIGNEQGLKQDDNQLKKNCLTPSCIN